MKMAASLAARWSTARMQKKGFSSIGTIKTNNFEFADGKVEGELTTDGQVDTFGETWEVNLKFVAPLGEIPKEFQVADEKDRRAGDERSRPAQAHEDETTDEATSEATRNQRRSRQRTNSTSRTWR